MAAASSDNKKNIKPSVYHGPHWHGFLYDFTLLQLDVKESWTFRQVFNTRCKTQPSTWLCEISFQKISDDGTVCFPVSLKRNDSNNNAVEVRIALRVRDLTKKHLHVSWTTTKEDIRGGVAIEETIKENVPFSKERSDFNRALNINLYMYILSCHSQPFSGKPRY
ncbi:unnamed protein product [Larinioides sclopetarius]|uniref:C2 NT-type domain-containing protein n=1 Tax=Larinioides sclopetarius TaxID=280406 RepID=A0AAV2BD18_9ARAC